MTDLRILLHVKNFFDLPTLLFSQCETGSVFFKPLLGHEIQHHPDVVSTFRGPFKLNKIAHSIKFGHKRIYVIWQQTNKFLGKGLARCEKSSNAKKLRGMGTKNLMEKIEQLSCHGFALCKS